MKSLALLVVVVVLGVLGGTAAAYPQFQLVRDQTCSGCHTSPAGGGLLNENGRLTAESISQFQHSPEFFYGKVPSPGWLQLGGDIRVAGGFIQTPDRAVTVFPMQFELYARAEFGNFSIYVAPGLRPATEGNEAATRVWAREHYVQWQQKKGETTGLFVRAGHFMPVFGLRLAEHPLYTRRFGGTQLFAETYGVAVEYVDPKFEFHVTGYIKDPVIDPVENNNGVAGYGEYRLSEKVSVGLEGKFDDSEDDKKFRIGATGKLHLPGPKLLLQAEVQFMNQLIDNPDGGPALGAPKQLIAYVMASRPFGENGQFLLDVGLGQFDPNIRIKNLDRQCVDVNFHWFATPHIEMVATTRYEGLTFGAGGPDGAYALLMAHYRM